MQQGKVEMPRTVLCGAIALAMVAGAHAVLAQTPTPPSPKDFVLAAAQSDQYEIMAANVALVEGQDQRVRTFAEEMIRDHDRLNGELRKAAVAARLPAPDSGLSSDQARLLGALQSLRGPDFDKLYAAQQTLAHAQAIAVVETFAAAGTDPNLRDMAQSILPAIQGHLKKAQQLRADVGLP